MIAWILKKLAPITAKIGKLYWPFTRKKITGKHYFKLRDNINPGTILLTVTRGEFSNYLNPAKLKHAAIYIGRIDSTPIRYVLEATGKGVVFTDLVTFMTTKDVLVISELSDSRKLFMKTKDDFMAVAMRYHGKGYDYLFQKGNDEYYCFELCVKVLKDLAPSLYLKCFEVVKGKQIYSEKTLLDPSIFKTVYDSRVNQ